MKKMMMVLATFLMSGHAGAANLVCKQGRFVQDIVVTVQETGTFTIEREALGSQPGALLSSGTAVLATDGADLKIFNLFTADSAMQPVFVGTLVAGQVGKQTAQLIIDGKLISLLGCWTTK